jgi:hypothetical protein
MLEAEVREWCHKHAMEFPPIAERFEGYEKEAPKTQLQILAAETETSCRLRVSSSISGMTTIRFGGDTRVVIDRYP